MKQIVRLLIAILLTLGASKAQAQCAFSGDIGNDAVPPQSYITGLVASGGSIEVYTTQQSTGTVTHKPMSLGTGVTATGTFGGTTSGARITSISATGSQWKMNDSASPSITFSGASFSGSFSWPGPGAGVTRILTTTSPAASIVFRGFNGNINNNNSVTVFGSGCPVQPGPTAAPAMGWPWAAALLVVLGAAGTTLLVRRRQSVG